MYIRGGDMGKIIIVESSPPSKYTTKDEVDEPERCKNEITVSGHLLLNTFSLLSLTLSLTILTPAIA